MWNSPPYRRAVKHCSYGRDRLKLRFSGKSPNSRYHIHVVPCLIFRRTEHMLNLNDLRCLSCVPNIRRSFWKLIPSSLSHHFLVSKMGTIIPACHQNALGEDGHLHLGGTVIKAAENSSNKLAVRSTKRTLTISHLRFFHASSQRQSEVQHLWCGKTSETLDFRRFCTLSVF